MGIRRSPRATHTMRPATRLLQQAVHAPQGASAAASSSTPAAAFTFERISRRSAPRKAAPTNPSSAASGSSDTSSSSASAATEKVQGPALRLPPALNEGRTRARTQKNLNTSRWAAGSSETIARLYARAAARAQSSPSSSAKSSVGAADVAEREAAAAAVELHSSPELREALMRPRVGPLYGGAFSAAAASSTTTGALKASLLPKNLVIERVYNKRVEYAGIKSKHRDLLRKLRRDA